MTLLQAILLGLFGWLGHTHTPFFGGGLTGWYTLGRPLVSGLVIGIILGNIPVAITLAAAVQALYIGLVTPGGSISPDMNLATWIAVPLGVVSGADAGITVALAAPLAVLASILSQPVHTIMLGVIQHQKKLVIEGNLEQATKVPIYGHIPKFLARFVPIVIFTYYGQDLLISVMNNSPDWLLQILTIFGRPMPLLGFALLLKMLVGNWFDFVYFTLGFVLVTVFKVDIITVVAVASVLAYTEFKISRSKLEGNY